MKKIVAPCTQTETENISVRYLEIFFTNDFEILFDDEAFLAKIDIYHEMLENVLLQVEQFYSNFGLKTAESVIYRFTSQIFCKLDTTMKFYIIANYFIFCRTYFIGSHLKIWQVNFVYWSKVSSQCFKWFWSYKK